MLKRWAGGGTILSPVAVDSCVVFAGTEYSLQSTVLHQGATKDSGHYVACARHPGPGGEWWWYNDEERRPALLSEVASDGVFKSYMAFYARVRLD